MQREQYENVRTWSVAEARRSFAELLRASAAAPQHVLNRGRPVAVLVSPEEWARFEEWRTGAGVGSLADAFAELRRILEEEGVALGGYAGREI